MYSNNVKTETFYNIVVEQNKIITSAISMYFSHFIHYKIEQINVNDEGKQDNSDI